MIKVVTSQYGNLVRCGNPSVMKNVTLLKIYIDPISSIVCLGCYYVGLPQQPCFPHCAYLMIL